MKYQIKNLVLKVLKIECGTTTIIMEKKFNKYLSKEEKEFFLIDEMRIWEYEEWMSNWKEGKRYFFDAIIKFDEKDSEIIGSTEGNYRLISNIKIIDAPIRTETLD